LTEFVDLRAAARGNHRYALLGVGQERGILDHLVEGDAQRGDAIVRHAGSAEQRATDRRSAAEEAMRNNEREQTQLWARMLAEIIEGEPEYHHYDEIYRTG